MKAGTTTLAKYLGSHPDIYQPPMKEPNHFCRELHDRGIGSRHPATAGFNSSKYFSKRRLPKRFFGFIETEPEYLCLYRDWSDEPYALDASTTYLNSPFAAGLIKGKSPNARILIMTRDPATRAWAEFVMNQRIGTTNNDWRAALDREQKILLSGEIPLFERYASTGLYAEHIWRYSSAFGDDRVLVFDIADLARDPLAVTTRLWSFLGLPCIDQHIELENRAILPRSPKLNKLIHRNQLRYSVAAMLPARIKATARRLFYSEEAPEMPAEFLACFPDYLASARTLWIRAGWDDPR